MRILGLKPGPLVGKAYNFLLELRLSEGMVGKERATAELLAWAEREGIEP
jgi:poly(A) polymerase